MHKIYLTDLTDNQWQFIERTLLFEERRRKHELKYIWNGIFYLVKLLSRLRESVRFKRKQTKEPSLGINDIDGNKKVKGIKRHVVVDKNGFLTTVMVTVASIHDAIAAYLLMRVLKELCSSVKTIIADGGYRGQLAENKRNIFGYVLQVIISGYPKQGFRPIKKQMDNRTYFCPNSKRERLN